MKKIFFLTLCAYNFCAQAKFLPLHSSLKPGGEPIDVWCFMNATDEPLSFKKCKETKEKEINVVGADEDSIKNGEYGYDYVTKEDPDNPSCYAYWGYLGDLSEGAPIIKLTNGGCGGTGRFSALYKISLSNDGIKKMESIGGGDRSMGGILNENVIKGKVIYEQSMTPAALFSLAQPHMASAKGIDSSALPDCAVCGVGAAEFEYDGKDSTLLSVSFEEDMDLPDPDAEDSRLWKAFREHYENSLKEGKTKFTPQEFYKFIEKVEAKSRKKSEKKKK